MSEIATDRTPPATLADVQKGDVVWVFHRRDLPRRLLVERLTPTQIVVGGMRFAKATKTRERTDRWGRGETETLCRAGDEIRGDSHEIAVGSEARRRIHFAHLKNVQSMALNHIELNTMIISHIRAACDAAEAALRELGEGEDTQ